MRLKSWLLLIIAIFTFAILAACSEHENDEKEQREATQEDEAVDMVIEEGCVPMNEMEGKNITLTAAPVFGSQMIVQREQPLIVWGTAEPCSAVVVAVGEQEAKTEADEGGAWLIELQPLPAGGPYEMKIASASDEMLVFDDILSGDVWLFAGQSNMNLMFGGGIAAEQQLPYADEIRSYRAAMPSIVFNPENAPENEWVRLADEMSQHFSMVAYYTLKNIYEREQVPQGMIVVAAGDSRVESFIDPAVMERDSELEQLLRGPISAPQHKQGLMYAHSVQPLVPLAIKGVVWYQGESNNQKGNGPGSAVLYKNLLDALFTNLRDDFNNDRLPIIAVQLPNFINDWNSFPIVRQAQLDMLQVSPYNGMVVTIDAGDPNDIHPGDKQPVGDRLGRWILNKVYGHEDIVASGPIVKQASASGNSAELQFEWFGSKGVVIHEDGLLGFELSDESSPDLFYEAQAELSDGIIKLSSNNVTAPAAARYAWGDNPAVSLYNEEGLPASPFWIEVE